MRRKLGIPIKRDEVILEKRYRLPSSNDTIRLEISKDGYDIYYDDEFECPYHMEFISSTGSVMEIFHEAYACILERFPSLVEVSNHI